MAGSKTTGTKAGMATTRPDVAPDFAIQLAGYGLTTAEIVYRFPDHPNLLQTYLWQEYDLHPRFPRLQSFLEYWTRNIHGPLHRVRVAHRGLVSAREFHVVDGVLVLH